MLTKGKSLCRLLMLLMLAACSGGEDKAKQPAAVKPPVAVETATAVAGDQVEGVEVTGNLEPKFWADVKTQVPGLVSRVFVTEWVRVRKGQPLARIDVAETEALVKRGEAAVQSARAGLAQAEVSAGRAERELARALKLKEAGLATLQSVEDANTEAAAAAARIDAAKAQIRVAEEDLRQARVRLSKGMVVSPLDGVVALRDINVGDLASDAAAGKPVFRIVDNRVLNLTVSVPSSESGRIRVGQRLEFNVDSLPGKTFSGKVMFINPELSLSDRSLRVIAEVPNSSELLKGGVFAKGKIVTGNRTAVLQVPRSAVAGLDAGDGSAALFVVAGDRVQKRTIRTGAANGDLLEVVQGISSGEQYVIRGGFNLRDGDRVAVVNKPPTVAAGGS